MRWLPTLLTCLLIAGCGCSELPETQHSPEPSRRNESPAKPPSISVPAARASNQPEKHPVGSGAVEPAMEAGAPDIGEPDPRRFTPNQRYGWPKDFLLPLIIEIEIPDVPEEIRGPSRPIEQLP